VPNQKNKNILGSSTAVFGGFLFLFIREKDLDSFKKVFVCFVCFLTSNVTSNPTTIVQPDSLSNESSDAHHGQTSIVQLLQLRLSEPSVAGWICWDFLETPGWPG